MPLNHTMISIAFPLLMMGMAACGSAGDTGAVSPTEPAYIAPEVAQDALPHLVGDNLLGQRTPEGEALKPRDQEFPDVDPSTVIKDDTTDTTDTADTADTGFAGPGIDSGLPE